MTNILQGSATQALMFLMVLTSDHITGATGLTPTVTLSKNGGAFGAPSGAVTEVANGWYKVAPNATDSNTLGPIKLHATAGTADPTDVGVGDVVAYNPQSATNLGLSLVPSNVVAFGGLAFSTGTAQSGSNSGITLQSGAAAATCQPGYMILLTGGTGAGQAALVLSVDFSVPTAPVVVLGPTGFTWPIVNPTAGTTYTIVQLGGGAPAAVSDVWINATRTITAPTNITSNGGLIPMSTNSPTPFVQTDMQSVIGIQLKQNGSSNNNIGG